VAARFEPLADPPRVIGHHRARQDDRDPRAKPRHRPRRSEQRCVRLLGGGHHDDAEVGVGHRLGRARGCAAAGAREAPNGLGADVEAMHLEPRVDEPGGHARAHRAEPDEADAGGRGRHGAPYLAH
jgi:hypothetical protein